MISGTGSYDRAMLYFDASRRMGWDWVAYRVWYAAKRKSGRLVAGSPATVWEQVKPSSRRPNSVVDPEGLRAWLSESYSGEQREGLRSAVGELRDRRFTIFGATVQVDDWHHDPHAGVRYPRDRHWSQVPEFPQADLKRVWEPSRFSWVFDLVRAEILLPELGAGTVFWDLVESWCEQNQPNQGVNWQCGQEASLRLMSITCAALAMPAQLTDYRMGLLQRLAKVTADRVLANIGYAKSQKNNHYASEAVGLLTASYLLEGDDIQSTDSEALWEMGEQHLSEMAELLIFPDGGSSQYSTNYHRVFVQDLVWAKCLATACGKPLSQPVDDGLTRAAKFLAAIVEPISGSGPFFGADDGARVLPLDRVAHRDLGHDALVACCVARIAVRHDTSPTGTEGLAWLGLTQELPNEEALVGAWTESYPDVGLHILGLGSVRVYVRCGPYLFRPSHEDQLHCDIWVDGVNTQSDAGTQSYKPAAGEPGSLSGVGSHNSPHLDLHPHMPSVGRFLKAKWCRGRAVSIGAEGAAATSIFEVELEKSVVFSRAVTLGPDGLSIVDSSVSQDSFVAIWDAPSNGAELDIVGAQQITDSRHKSIGYGSSALVPAHKVVVAAGGTYTLRLDVSSVGLQNGHD